MRRQWIKAAEMITAVKKNFVALKRTCFSFRRTKYTTVYIRQKKKCMRWRVISCLIVGCDHADDKQFYYGASKYSLSMSFFAKYHCFSFKAASCATEGWIVTTPLTGSFEMNEYNGELSATRLCTGANISSVRFGRNKFLYDKQPVEWLIH